MALTRDDKKGIMGDHAKHKKDNGSTEVQLAILTARIEYLTGHLKEHKKDHSARRGLLKLVQRRKNLLNYLEKKDSVRHDAVCKKLGLGEYKKEKKKALAAEKVGAKKAV